MRYSDKNHKNMTNRYKILIIIGNSIKIIKTYTHDFYQIH